MSETTLGEVFFYRIPRLITGGLLIQDWIS